MENILQDAKKIYFVGIGGIAMSAAAGLAQEFGLAVCGSDAKSVYAPAKEVLDEFNISYQIGYDEKNIIKNPADVYVLSAGEDERNPEVKYIMDRGLPRISFPELLYWLTREKLRVVVAGTNGKSTTAGLLGHLLKNIDDSSFMVGAVLQNYESNYYKGDGHYFVFEGDEYKSQFDDPTPKFHYYKPDILVLTNVEFDHPDVFENLEAIEREFEELIESMPQDGLIVYNADNAVVSRLVHKSNVSSVSFGIDNEADFMAGDLEYGRDFTQFSVHNKFSKNVSQQLLGATEDYKTRLPGKINVYNALASVATLRSLGFAYDQIALELLTYGGVKRRFEKVGEKNGIVIIDDYAHHPTAVLETLQAARLRYFPETPQKDASNSKLWAVFEPHTFSRTKATLEDLVKSFDLADEVLIAEIYPARESAKNAAISSAEVVRGIKKHGKECNIHNSVRQVKDQQEAMDILKAEAKPGDMIIVMAVGSFNRLAYDLKANL